MKLKNNLILLTKKGVNVLDNSEKIILSLCGGSGSWEKFYKEAGYIVHNITLPYWDVTKFDYGTGYIAFRSNDGTNPKLIFTNNVYGVLAAPPCTEFTILKNNSRRDLDGAMKIVNACLNIVRICEPKFWALENPSGKLSSFLGKPKFSFQPYEFGDAWTKRTNLWGNFNPPIKLFKNYSDLEPIPGLYVRPNRKTVSLAFGHYTTHAKLIPQYSEFLAYCETQNNKDAAFRALTPPGFAKAFFEANK